MKAVSDLPTDAARSIRRPPPQLGISPPRQYPAAATGRLTADRRGVAGRTQRRSVLRVRRRLLQSSVAAADSPHTAGPVSCARSDQLSPAAGRLRKCDAADDAERECLRVSA